jgi:hypothetical protein
VALDRPHCGQISARPPILGRVLARTIPLLLAGLFAAGGARAQTPEALPLVTVPAMTPVTLRLGAEISSKTSKPGDHFPISIAEDVRIGDAIVIPAGSAGEGEVIHAAHRKAGGAAGELILAARFVRVDDRQVRLRSFDAGGVGKDNGDSALAVAVFGGPLAFLVRGGEKIFPLDAIASAKTAEEIQLPARESNPPADGRQPVEPTNEGEKEDVSKTN